ncbi:MAG: DUF4429 domain-containing protein [Collimonas sp.]|uniref:DUF4429 domain-containing protein n=1 Tax=Collimonas sp. TaxID=1963772 RepID=UPI00326467B7
MQVRGVNGQVTLLSDRIQIKRAGAMARLTQAKNGDKDILIADLSGVRIQLPSLMSNGYIRFFLVNGESADASLIRAAGDANTVLVNGWQLTRFTLLKSAVEKKIAALQPSPVLLLPAPEVLSEPVSESVLEPVPEPVSEPVPEAVSESVPEPVSELAPESVSEPEPTSEEPPSVLESAPESVAEAAPEPVSEPASEITPEISPAITPVATPAASPTVSAGLPPIDFEQLDLLAEQYKQGLISRSEWVSAKKKLLRL